MNLTSSVLRHPLLWQVRNHVPGLMVCGVIAVAATFVSEHHGGPIFLNALLLGIAFHFLADSEKCAPGIEIAARRLVRIGVALLGVRISAGDVVDIGGIGIAALAGAVVLTIAFGLVFARLLKLPPSLGILSGGATGICGVSAALAISSTLPRSRDNERFTLITAIGVATISTIAMVAYPAMVSILELSPQEAALFLGGSIHDVSQVVGAGFMISPAVGDGATLAKMFRVAMLLPVVVLLAMWFRTARKRAGEDSPRARMPPFLIVFALLVLANSLGWLPAAVVSTGSDVSRWCLLISIAALGVKTSFGRLAELGWRPIALLSAEALFIAAYMLGVVLLLRTAGPI